MKDAKPVSINKVMSSAHFLVDHGNFKCQVSIYPSLDEDSIKSSLDPTSADLKLLSKEIAATLLGAASSPHDDATIQYDRSKARLILTELDILDTAEQDKILNEFRKWESRSESPTKKSEKPPPT